MAATVLVLAVVAVLFIIPSLEATPIQTTLDGPFKPVTVSFPEGHRGAQASEDLPPDDPRVQRRVTGIFPEQISVSLSTHGSAWISWITGDFQIGDDVKPLDASSVDGVVKYGESEDNLCNEASGYSLVYSQLYPFAGLQNYTSGIIHHVRLTGLKASTRYYYKCGDPYQSAMSKVLSFKTMPAPGPKMFPDRIAIVGDLGLTYNTTSTIDHLSRNDPDLILLVGDVTYANLYLTNGTGSECYSCSFPDSPIHETHQPRWDYWGRFMEPLISQVPTMVVEGNHEIEEQVEHKMFTAYQSRFAFPSEESGSRSPFYYSFDAGGIHFVMIGGYIDYNKTGEQYRWLENDLANVDRSVTPWLVATWHPPWYSSYRAHYREADCMRQEMEELLYKHGVDVVFNGHVHAYERSNRVFNYTLDPCAPVHITIGDGGNREKMAVLHADDPGNCPKPSSTPYAFMGGLCAYNFTSGPAAGKFCWDRQPDFSAYRESSFGHGILEVKNETHALWTWHRNQDAYNSKGDQIYIVRQPGVCSNQPKAFQSIPFFKKRKYRRIDEDTMVARAVVIVLMLTLVLGLLGTRLEQR